MDKATQSKKAELMLEIKACIKSAQGALDELTGEYVKIELKEEAWAKQIHIELTGGGWRKYTFNGNGRHEAAAKFAYAYMRALRDVALTNHAVKEYNSNKQQADTAKIEREKMEIIDNLLKSHAERVADLQTEYISAEGKDKDRLRSSLILEAHRLSTILSLAELERGKE